MFTIQSDEVSTINQNDVQLWLDNFVKVLGSVGTPIIYYQISSFLKDEEMNSIVNVPEMIFFTLDMIMTQISSVIMMDVADAVGAPFISLQLLLFQCLQTEPPFASICLSLPKGFFGCQNWELMPHSPAPPSSPQSITAGSWYVKYLYSFACRELFYTTSEIPMKLTFS